MRDGSQLERRAQDGGAGRGPVRLVVAAVFAALAMHALGCAGTEEVTGPDRSRAEECTRPPCGDRGSGRTLCDPPCATGTACVEGVCIEDCNPPCSPGYHCTAERVCAPDSTPDAGDVDPVDARPGDVPAVLDVAAEVDARGSSDLPPPRDTAAEDEEESCALATLTAENRVLPADIVLVVDTSGSMDQEEETVEDKLDEFADFVTGSGIDLRVVLVAERSVCLPEPLSATPGCPDTDSAIYRHVDREVDSSEVFESILSTFSDWSDFLRPDAVLQFIAVTDDNDDIDWRNFRHDMEDLAGPFTFHAIVAQGSVPIVGCIHPVYGTGAAIGRHYMNLAGATGGVSASICTDDWLEIFRAIAEGVIAGAVLPCAFGIPDPGSGLEVDPDEVNVYYTPPGSLPAALPNVAGPEECGGRSAWYFDDPELPTTIILCDAICGAIDGEVTIELGCETIKV